VFYTNIALNLLPARLTAPLSVLFIVTSTQASTLSRPHLILIRKTRWKKIKIGENIFLGDEFVARTFPDIVA